MSEVTVLPWSELEEEFAGTGSPGGGGALLLGNGFSQNIWSGFGYRRLLDCSGLSGVAGELFGDRTNFETVLAELAVTERVLGVAAPAHTEIGEQLRELASEVRDGLRAAVDNVHPELRDLVVEESRDGSDGFKRRVNVITDRVEDYLCRHSSIFTTNYDLLCYWPVVSGRAADLFPGGDPFSLARAEGWATFWSSAIYFLHGSLFLWRDLAEGTREGKYLAGSNADSLLNEIRRHLADGERAPLFISEGTSEDKVSRIGASPYLRFCSRQLQRNHRPLTVLGHSLSEVDQHICDAIQDGNSAHRRVAVGVWVAPEGNRDQLIIQARELRGRLPRCQDIVFFNSAEHPLTSPDLHVEE